VIKSSARDLESGNSGCATAAAAAGCRGGVSIEEKRLQRADNAAAAQRLRQQASGLTEASVSKSGALEEGLQAGAAVAGAASRQQRGGRWWPRFKRRSGDQPTAAVSAAELTKAAGGGASGGGEISTKQGRRDSGAGCCAGGCCWRDRAVPKVEALSMSQKLTREAAVQVGMMGLLGCIGLGWG